MHSDHVFVLPALTDSRAMMNFMALPSKLKVLLQTLDHPVQISTIDGIPSTSAPATSLQVSVLHLGVILFLVTDIQMPDNPWTPLDASPWSPNILIEEGDYQMVQALHATLYPLSLSHPHVKHCGDPNRPNATAFILCPIMPNQNISNHLHHQSPMASSLWKRKGEYFILESTTGASTRSQ